MNGLDGLASPHKLRKHVALPLQTAGKSHRLPTYVDYSTSKARLSDADDKHKKYKSGWTANVHGKARNLSGWPGALLRYLIRAGASKKQFWKKTVLLAFVGLLLFVSANDYGLNLRLADLSLTISFYTSTTPTIRTSSWHSFGEVGFSNR